MRHDRGVDLASLYDTGPLVICLVGGYHDGQRVTIGRHGWPWLLLMPGAPTPIPLAGEPSPGEMPYHPRYQCTESINDQGERVYRYIGER